MSLFSPDICETELLNKSNLYFENNVTVNLDENDTIEKNLLTNLSVDVGT